MKINEYLKKQEKSTCVALGFFDGLHKGHMKVISEMLYCSKKNKFTSCIFTYKNSPKNILHKGQTNKILLDYDRNKMLESLGLQELYTVDFKNVMNLTADEFINEILFNTLKAKHIFCGFNYHFGKGGQFGAEDLKNKCQKHAIQVHVVEPVKHKDSDISSSTIRKLLYDGKVDVANELLSENFHYTLSVSHGRRIAQNLHFPTINQEFPENFIVPKCGSYLSCVTVNGNKYKSITNIGVAPTVKRLPRPISETHILGDNSVELYYKTVKVELLKFLRPERKFESMEKLKRTVAQDCNVALKWHFNV